MRNSGELYMPEFLGAVCAVRQLNYLQANGHLVRSIFNDDNNVSDDDSDESDGNEDNVGSNDNKQ
jgi:hypothetical protein